MSLLQMSQAHLSACSSLRRAPFTVAKPNAAAKHMQCGSSRRDSLAAVALAPFVSSLFATPSVKADEQAVAQPRQYIDQEDSFSLTIPAGWDFAQGQLEGNRSFQGVSGARRTLAWFPTGNPADQVNVTLTITNTSVEFTGLGRYAGAQSSVPTCAAMSKQCLLDVESTFDKDSFSSNEECSW